MTEGGKRNRWQPANSDLLVDEDALKAQLPGALDGKSTALVPFKASYVTAAMLKTNAVRVTYGSARWLARIAVVVALLGIIGFAALYTKLSYAPISMSFLVPPIENAVNRTLSGLHFDIGDAVLRRSDSGFGVEFRLTAVRLVEDGGGPIVESPLASASVSLRALLTGHLAAGRIDLIGPRLFLQYTEERGLALSFVDPRDSKGDLGAKPETPQGPGGVQSEAEPTQPQADGETPVVSDAARQGMIRQARGRAVNLTHAFNDIFDATRRGESAFLNGFGIRDATVFFDRGEQITRWTVPSVEVDLQHKGKNSAVVGQVAIRSATDDFQLRFRAGQNRRTGELDLSVAVDDVVPRDLGKEFPMFQLPKAWNMPVSLSADMELAGNGDILGATVHGTLKQGTLYAPWDERHPAQIDYGDLQSHLFPGRRRDPADAIRIALGRQPREDAGRHSTPEGDRSLGLSGGCRRDRARRGAVRHSRYPARPDAGAGRVRPAPRRRRIGSLLPAGRRRPDQSERLVHARAVHRRRSN